MGRIKTQLTKRLGIALVKEHKEKLSTEFSKNKELVDLYLEGPSKKLRNIIAGYVTRLMKHKEEY